MAAHGIQSHSPDAVASNPELHFHSPHAVASQRHMQFVNRNAPARRVPDAVWGQYRERITHLYLKEEKTLDDIMSVLATEYDFTPSKKQIVTRLRRWNLRKYQRKALPSAEADAKTPDQQDQSKEKYVTSSCDSLGEPGLNVRSSPRSGPQQNEGILAFDIFCPITLNASTPKVPGSRLRDAQMDEAGLSWPGEDMFESHFLSADWESFGRTSSAGSPTCSSIAGPQTDHLLHPHSDPLSSTNSFCPSSTVPLQPPLSAYSLPPVSDIVENIGSNDLPDRNARHFCPSCTTSFSRKTDLSRHFLNVHERPSRYLCHLHRCPRGIPGKGFARKDKLVDHLKKKHALNSTDAAYEVALHESFDPSDQTAIGRKG